MAATDGRRRCSSGFRQLLQRSFIAKGAAAAPASKGCRPDARPQVQVPRPSLSAGRVATPAEARAARARPDRARAGRCRDLLRVPDLPALGRRRGGQLGGRRAAPADRRGPLRRAGRAAGGRRDPRAAADAAGRAAVPRRRRCACSRRSRSAWRPARSASAPVGPPCTGTPSGCGRAAGSPARRCTGAPRRRSAPSARTSSRCSASSPRRCCSPARRSRASCRRPTTSVSTTTRDMRAAVQRRRTTEELGRWRRARAASRAARGRPSRSSREGDAPDPEAFWSGPERFPDLYDEDDDGGAGARSPARA